MIKCVGSRGPHGFARRHLMGGPAIIKLEVSNGRYWPVQILQHEHQLVTLTKGWSQFVGEMIWWKEMSVPLNW